MFLHVCTSRHLASLGASMVALGAFAAATGLVSDESLHAALDEVLPPHRRAAIDGNRRCLERGAAFVAATPAAGGPRAWT